MNQYIRKAGCLSLLIYFLSTAGIVLFILVISKDVFRMFVLNKIERKKFIVDEFIENYPSGDDTYYTYVNGFIEGVPERLYVDEVKFKNDTIDVWYYKYGWRDFPVAACRVWVYMDKSEMIQRFKRKLTILISLTVVFIIVYGFNYYKLRKVKED